jgi:hypothetical protein
VLLICQSLSYDILSFCLCIGCSRCFRPAGGPSAPSATGTTSPWTPTRRTTSIGRTRVRTSRPIAVWACSLAANMAGSGMQQFADPLCRSVQPLAVPAPARMCSVLESMLDYRDASGHMCVAGGAHFQPYAKRRRSGTVSFRTSSGTLENGAPCLFRADADCTAQHFVDGTAFANGNMYRYGPSGAWHGCEAPTAIVACCIH